ncbi:MAG: cytochrome c-type biosis protein CcmH [Proteobacteria bacterium]|nr:cytochrome c-type biosis protein CcmH [Pseudomonadota bacterium]
MRKLFALVLLICSLPFTAHAAEAQRVSNDPVLEAKVQSLSEVLRCLVCQNQNLADSHADLAIDLKNQVRDMLREGKTEKEVIDYMVERYGDFVLYRPPLKTTTWLLWGGPFLLLFGGLAGLFFMLRRRREQEAPPLDDAQHAAASHLLHG